MGFAKLISDKGLASRIYEKVLQFNNKRTNNSIKSQKEILTDISPKKVHKWMIGT